MLKFLQLLGDINIELLLLFILNEVSLLVLLLLLQLLLLLVEFVVTRLLALAYLSYLGLLLVQYTYLVLSCKALLLLIEKLGSVFIFFLTLTFSLLKSLLLSEHLKHLLFDLVIL